MRNEVNDVVGVLMVTVHASLSPRSPYCCGIVQMADKMQVWEAQRESENVHIEQVKDR